MCVFTGGKQAGYQLSTFGLAGLTEPIKFPCLSLLLTVRLLGHALADLCHRALHCVLPALQLLYKPNKAKGSPARDAVSSSAGSHRAFLQGVEVQQVWQANARPA